MEGGDPPEVLCDSAWGTSQGDVSIMYILGVRAVKGADADKVLFVG
jgi:hypothetical protein